MTTWDNIERVLQSYDLQREASGEYRVNSPLRVGANSHSFHIKVDTDGEHGTFYDHASGEKGSLYDLADKLNIPRVGVKQVEDSKRAYTGLDDYAKAHGVDTWVFRTAGWRDEIEMKDNRKALVFYTGDYKRFRFIDGEKPKYKSAWGYKRSLYKFDEAISIARTKGLPLILCNGEPSVVVAQYFDLPATCLTAGEEGYSNFPPQFIQQIKDAYQGEVIIALDCDKTGRDSAAAAVTALTAAGVPARAVDLGLSTGGDLADLCKLHGDGVGDVVRRLPPLGNYAKNETPITISRDEFKIIHADELKNLPPLTYLIKDMIVENGLNMLFGPPGVGKSFIALDWSLRIAQTQPVLYVAREGSSGYDMRVESWVAANRKGKGKLFFGLSPISLFYEDQVTAFIEAARKVMPKMIVFDTLAKCITGADENSSRDMGIVIANCDRIREALGCAILLIHHSAKGSRAERGSSALRGAMDSAIYVEKDDDIINVESDKLKDGEGFKPLCIKLVKFADSVTVMPVDKTILRAGEALTGGQRKILVFLAMDIFETLGARSNKIKEGAGLSDGSFYRSLNALLKLKYIQRPMKGEPYTITDLGRQMLEK